MSTEGNKALVRRFYEEVVNKQNWEVLDKIASTSYVNHGPMGDIKSHEDYKQHFKMILTAFPDHHMMIKDMVGEGDKVATRITAQATQKGDYMGVPPTGKQFSVTMIVISRIADGKIVEEWEVVDQLGIMKQLGIIPPVGGG